MSARLFRAFWLACLLVLVFAGNALGVPPPAPTVLAPASGASVQIPFTASWSAVNAPGIIAYNWQISPSSTFSPVVKIDSTNGATQSVVSGLANGTYFFRVQAVNSGFEQGAWSAARSFTVSGAGAQAPGAARLDPPVGYSTFHPWENMRFTWSAVPGAVSYIYEASRDARFPITSTIRFDNIPEPRYGFAIANPEGNYTARVFAVNADGVVGQPSNTIQFSVFYNNPVPPAPQPVSPANGATLTLPITLAWTHTLNPQDGGYEVQVSPTPDFRTNEVPTAVQITNNNTTILSLTSGTKHWRVRSHQGDSSPTTAAVTAWSAVRTFTVSSAPPVPVSITPLRVPLYSGDDTLVDLQLSGAVPAGGGTVALSSSHPNLLPVPASHTIQGTHAWSQFQVVAGQVTVPTPITLTATYNGSSASSQVTLQPPTLKTLTLFAPTVSGGVPTSGMVTLAGRAPAGGAVVSLSSNSAVVQPPASVTVPAGSYSAPFSLPTSDVAAKTNAVVTASWNGVSTTASLAVMPGAKPVSLSLFPATINAGGVSDGLVTVDTTANFDQMLTVSSNNPDILPFLSTAVVVPAGDNRGRISLIARQVVSQSTIVRVSVTGGGVTQTADLTVNPSGTPPPPPPLTSLTVTPTSVPGGQSATGRVTLSAAAPAGGTTVALGSNLPGAASVPASVVVPAGATSASFTITTFPSAGTTVQLSARLGDAIVFASLSVTAAPAGPTLSSVSLSPASVTGGGSSTGTVTLSGAAPSGGAAVTLSDNSSAIGTPPSVTVPAGASSANFTVTTVAVSTATSGVVTASYAGSTRSASLSVNPASSVPAAPTLVSPASGSTPPQPVTLDWNNVTGAASYRIQVDDQSTFAAPFVVDQVVSTSQIALPVLPGTTHRWRVQAINAAGVAGAWSSTRTFTPQAAPAPPGQPVTLSVSASGRSGERVTSNPAGISVAVGSTGSATFATGTAVTLTVSNSRDAIWSGACSSGGAKARTCTFTINGTASVAANVQ